MTDLDVVYLAVASSAVPISSAIICSITEMEREAVSKALHQLHKTGRVMRHEVPNPNAGRNGQKGTLFVYTASTPKTGKASLMAEPIGDTVSPIPTPSKAKQEADGWTGQTIQDAALPAMPAHRWLVTPMGKTLDTREAAVDAAVALATSEGIAFAVCLVEAVASVKVEINWED